MNGLSNYRLIDHSSDNNPANLGTRRLNPFGTLVHTTGGTSSLAWLLGGAAATGAPASANCLIDRDGTQHRLCDNAHYPYHAGVSYFYHNGAYTGDELSEALIGVELECLDDQAPTYEQIDSLASVILAESIVWAWRWPFILVGHYAVARPIGRRLDPVNMEWGGLMGRLYVRAKAAGTPGL